MLALRACCNVSLVGRGFGHEGVGPAAVLVYGFVDFAHQPNRLANGDDHFLVMLDVFLSQFPPWPWILAPFGLTVFEPFFERLVTSNEEVPFVSGNSIETAFCILVDPDDAVFK